MRSNKWWLDKKGDCSSSSSRSRRSRRRGAGAMRRNSRWAGDQKLPNAILHFQILPYCDPTIPGKRFIDIAGGTTGWLTFPFRAVWLRNKQMRARKRIPIMSGVTQTKIHQPPFVWVWSGAAQAIFRSPGDIGCTFAASGLSVDCISSRLEMLGHRSLRSQVF